LSTLHISWFMRWWEWNWRNLDRCNVRGNPTVTSHHHIRSIDLAKLYPGQLL
jgi:hypothetical protein